MTLWKNRVYIVGISVENKKGNMNQPKPLPCYQQNDI